MGAVRNSDREFPLKISPDNSRALAVALSNLVLPGVLGDHPVHEDVLPQGPHCAVANLPQLEHVLNTRGANQQQLLLGKCSTDVNVSEMLQKRLCFNCAIR